MKKKNLKIPEAYILAHRNESNLVDQYYKHVFQDYETAILELKQMHRNDKKWHIMQFTELNWIGDERNQKIYERN